MLKKKNIPSNLILFLVILFFYIPIILMVVFSFNSTKSMTVFESFSFRWYQEIFQNRMIKEAVLNTVLVAIVSTVISTIVGTITAIGLTGSRKIIRDIVLNINNLPILNPEIVTAISLMIFIVSLGIEKGLVTMLLAHIAFSIPYVILTLLPKVRSLDANLSDAAMDLGATPWQALRRVILPQLKTGIIAGALIAFTMSFDDFVISYFVSGNVQNISIFVYTMRKRLNPSVNALSTLIVIVITVVLIIINVIPLIKNRKVKKNEKNYS